jgi:hypothetical protein
MTIHFFDDGHFFASPGVHPQPAAKARANDYSPLQPLPGGPQRPRPQIPLPRWLEGGLMRIDREEN